MTNLNANNFFSKDEIRELMKRSNWKAAWEVSFTWGVIIASFAMVALWTNPFTILLAIILVGGRQLALAILMHDASHYALFETREQNINIGRWLFAYPIFHNLEAYRLYHLEHHNHTGTALDPDLPLVKAYPTSRPSMARKVGRDLSGIAGLKAHAGIMMMHFGYLQYSLGGLVIRLDQKGRQLLDVISTGGRNLYGPLLVNLLMLTVFILIGQWWLYLIWVGSMVTTAMFFARIRSIAEHAVTPDPADPFNNTRTTYARWWERLLFAPHHVHYHLEHHLIRTVPPYNLEKMHYMLKERGHLKDACVADGYWDVFKSAMSLQR
jgi:fatty acid desaturase